jgi:signal transduction histidine kinase/CheY-like chemotaxis protein/ligand-binding sensor domain-containing protein
MRNRFAFSFWVFIILISTICPSLSQSIGGNTLIKNFNSNDYLTPENQIWSILQNQDGIMYFGNNNGVLEYDGTYWNLITIPNKSTIRSLAENKINNRIYVGAAGDFGYLQKDIYGKNKFVSLLNKVPDEYQNFEDVWKIFVIDDQIIFETFSYIFILENNKIKTIVHDNEFHIGFKVNNKYYIREWNKGIHVLENDQLKFILGSEKFANERIYAMLPLENDKILMASRTKGIIIYDPSNDVSKRFVKDNKFNKIDDFIIKNQVYCAIKIDDKKIALGTFHDGIIIFDNQGNITNTFNIKSGLQDQMILSLYLDKSNNIWTGLNNGISYIINNSPFTFYNDLDGLLGTVNDAKFHKNKLYTSTSRGLFYRGSSDIFKLITNTKGPCYNLIEIDGELFACHTEGFFVVKDNIAHKISNNIGTSWNLNKLNNKSELLAGTRNGISILEKKNGEWTVKNKLKGFNETSRYVEIDWKNNIWVSHSNKGIFRIRLNESQDSILELDFFNAQSGLPSNTNNYVFNIINESKKKEIVFGTENGIYKFNYNTDSFEPHQRFEMLSNKKGFIDKFIQDKKGNIYFQQDIKKGILFKVKDTYQLKYIPFLKQSDLFIESISIVDSSKILYCSRKGIIQYNPLFKKSENEFFKVRFRSIHVNDSIALPVSNNGDYIALTSHNNNLLFKYSALFYEESDKTQYRYKLIGLNSNWSDWSTKTEKEFTNLPAGYYTFQFKARNIYNQESNLIEYHFFISLPWYKTIAAYFAYGVLAILLIWVSILLYTKKLKTEKENLEKTVKEKTKDLHEINTLLEENQADLEIKQEEITAQAEHLKMFNTELELHKDNLEKLILDRTKDLEIAKEKAEQSDKLKSAFLANMSHEIRTPMNAIIGFSHLLNDKGINDQNKSEIISHIIHNSDTLLSLIDDIIDLSKIEASQLEINQKECKINVILEELFKTFSEKKKNIKKEKIQLILKPEVKNLNFTILTDPLRVLQVLTNLIDNALKFTETGLIEFGYTIEEMDRNSKIIFYVKDTGIGLSGKDQEIIFKRFTKLENDRKKLYRGAGLGLSICKNISSLLNGNIWLESELNKGSCFYFSIPFINILESKEESTLKEINETFDWTNKTILIAEDEESNYQFLEMLLVKTNVNLLRANDGIEAIQLFKDNKVDLILMDIKMPNMDGIEATKEIRKVDSEIPIIIQSAFAMENDEIVSLKAGCNDYISKPIKKDILLKKANKLLNKSI